MVSSQVDQVFRMCKHEEMQSFADLIQDIPLTLADRFTLCQAPVNVSKPDVAAAVHLVACRCDQSQLYVVLWVNALGSALL